MWSAIKENIGLDTLTGEVIVTVIYTNGITKIKDNIHSATPETVDSIIENRITQLQSVSDYVANSVIGDVVVAKESAGEIAKREFGINLQKLQRMRQAVDLQIIPDTDSDYLTILQKVQNTFLPEYTDVI